LIVISQYDETSVCFYSSQKLDIIGSEEFDISTYLKDKKKCKIIMEMKVDH
jgi:hypothetical protein